MATQMFPKPPSDHRVAGQPLPVRLGILILVAVYPTIGWADSCDRVTVLEGFATTGAEPNGSTCATYAGLNGTNGVSCYWAFPFRSHEAAAFSNDVWTEVKRCRVGHASPDTNPVNHPDSYDVRALNANQGIYRVTTKDKNQRQRTFVFLSVEQKG